MTSPASTPRRRGQTDLMTALADVLAALPKGTTFLDWYECPDFKRLVGSRPVRATARDAWNYLEGQGDALGLTVRELLDAEEIDYGDDE